MIDWKFWKRKSKKNFLAILKDPNAARELWRKEMYEKWAGHVVNREHDKAKEIMKEIVKDSFDEMFKKGEQKK